MIDKDVEGRRAKAYLIIFTVFLLISVFPNLLTSNEKYQTLLPSFALGISASMLVLLIVEVVSHLEHFKLWVLSKTRYRQSDIRCTAAYIFKIKYNDCFLMVPNKRFAVYQPPGGVYKRYPSALGSFRTLGINIKDDNLLSLEKSERDDLRLSVKGKDLLKFIGWYKSQKDREVCQLREFKEELLDTEIFSKELFSDIRYQFLGREPIKIQRNKEGKLEAKIIEVYELLPTADQESALEMLYKIKAHDKYIWVDQTAIEKHIYKVSSSNRELRLGDHTHYILTT